VDCDDDDDGGAHPQARGPGPVGPALQNLS